MKQKTMSKFIKNHDQSLQKARANDLTANTNAPLAEGKIQVFPALKVVG